MKASLALGFVLLALPAAAQPFILPLQQQRPAEPPAPPPSPVPVAPPQAGGTVLVPASPAAPSETAPVQTAPVEAAPAPR